MKKLLLLLIALSVCFSNQSINKIIGNRGFEIKYGRSPNEYDNKKIEIISHLKFVYDSLSNLKLEDLNKLQLTNRTKHLNSLKKYISRGVFPLNNLYFDRVPVFVDELNTHCAVAYILKEDDQFEIINNIQRNYNYNYIEDMNLDPLSFWLQNSGLSLNELALIQPTYDRFRRTKPKIDTVIDTSLPLIYYKNGTIANPDSIGRTCSMALKSAGVKIIGISLWECFMYSYNGDEYNIIDLEQVDRLERKSGEIISGEMAIKKLRKYQFIFTSTTFITVGSIFISLLLFA